MLDFGELRQSINDADTKITITEKESIQKDSSKSRIEDSPEYRLAAYRKFMEDTFGFKDSKSIQNDQKLPKETAVNIDFLPGLIAFTERVQEAIIGDALSNEQIAKSILPSDLGIEQRTNCLIIIDAIRRMLNMHKPNSTTDAKDNVDKIAQPSDSVIPPQANPTDDKRGMPLLPIAGSIHCGL